jgi:hypothetical protein
LGERDRRSRAQRQRYSQADEESQTARQTRNTFPEGRSATPVQQVIDMPSFEQLISSNKQRQRHLNKKRLGGL